MSIAEELVKVLPKEWGLRVFGDEISVSQFITSLRQDIHLDGEQESPAFINWALDELAKRGYGPVMTFNGNEWEVEVALIPNTFRSERCSEGEYPTKTLALAHALIACLEVSRG